MTAVELRRVAKTYPDGHVAVRGIDLSIADGEFFVLVGPSGCGKSTVLRMIAGLEQVTAGDISFDGESVLDRPAAHRGLSMLFQDSTLYPHMTVRENLDFPLRIAGLRPAEIGRSVATVAARLQLGDLLDKRPKRLSGGQRQRVAMGRAMIREPSLVLMDEPMSNLDAKLRTELRGQIAHLHRELGTTTIYVTHDQVEAMALGDRLAVMRGGSIVQVGRPDDVYFDPVDLFAATFIGSPTMNVIVASVVDATTLRTPSGDIALGQAGSRWPLLPDLVGSDVAVGFRPEHAQLSPTGGLSVEIASVEWTGVQQFIEVRIGAPSVLVDGHIQTVSPGPSSATVAVDTSVEPDLYRPVALALDATQIHLFDLDSGRRLDAALVSA